MAFVDNGDIDDVVVDDDDAAAVVVDDNDVEQTCTLNIISAIFNTPSLVDRCHKNVRQYKV